MNEESVAVISSVTAQPSVIVEFDVPARMRDGVILRADVYRPSGDGPWPALVVRTPYNKSGAADDLWNGFSPTEVARQGFMMVIQDVRGRYASDGAWEPLRHEGHDGADAIAWAAELRGSNGRVGMLGGSYCGHTQWRAAIEQPPALKAITPLMTWAEPSEALVARGGATQFSVIVGWAMAAAFDWLSRQGLTQEEMANRSAALIKDLDNLEGRLLGATGNRVARLKSPRNTGHDRSGSGHRRRGDAAHAHRRPPRPGHHPESEHGRVVRQLHPGHTRRLHDDARSRTRVTADRNCW
ncbi:CocE/NonD family hydrolase [Arthrobacter sp. ISL-65]|nr:CocE/NonD family hydrolase [Arthrobacter sp. ISL-65]